VRATPSRLRGVAISAVALLVPALSVFAVAGSLHKTPTFTAIPVEVPPGAVLVVGLTATSFACVGAVVAFRARGNPIGWLLWVFGLCAALALASIVDASLGWPTARWAEWLAEWISVVPFACMAYVLLLFPDGRLLSPRWRPGLWLTHLTLVAILLAAFTPYTRGRDYAYDNPVGISGYRKGVYGVVLNNGNLAWALLPLAIVVGAVSFVVRCRQSSGVQRLQLKWFSFAAGVNATAFSVMCIAYVVTVVTSIKSFGPLVLLMVLCVNAIPIASGVAILRYRLYDIDRIISRALAYLLVSSVLVGIYVAVVTAATAVLPSHSAVTVAAATLVAAAMLEPTRRRAQNLVDRRFNRARFDAIKTVEAFATRQRDRVDPQEVCDDLSGTVNSTLEPATVIVWIRQPERAAANAQP
jgi:hypothetical protein